MGLSEDQRLLQNERNRLQRERKVQAALCVSCGTKSPRPQTQECQACAKQRKERRSNRRLMDEVVLRRCQRCGGELTERKHVSCTSCRVQRQRTETPTDPITNGIKAQLRRGDRRMGGRPAEVLGWMMRWRRLR